MYLSTVFLMMQLYISGYLIISYLAIITDNKDGVCPGAGLFWYWMWVQAELPPAEITKPLLPHILTSEAWARFMSPRLATY